MKHKKKIILTPLILTVVLLAAYPFLQMGYILEDKDKTSPNDTPNNTNDNSLIDEILDSFGLKDRAFADCGTYGTNCQITAPDICVQGDQTYSGAVSAQSSGGSVTYPIALTIQNVFSIDFTPSTQSFNDYPSGTPTSHNAAINYDVTGPTVSESDDPGDASGPYGGLGRKLFTINVQADYHDYNAGSWIGSTSTINDSFVLAVDHANNAPTLGSISSDYSASVANSSTLTDVSVSVSFDDVESNQMTVTFYLTNDSYETVLQTAEVTNVSSGEIVNYTFTDLPIGTYQWSAEAFETDAVGSCIGFSSEQGNLYFGSDNVNINITQAGSTTTTTSTTTTSGGGSVNAPVCSDQKPGTPSNLTVSGPKAGQVQLSWIAPQGPVTDYSISYSDDTSIKKWGVVSTGNVTSYTISGLDDSKTYYFWLNAVNGCMPGDSITPSAPSLLQVGPSDILKIGLIGMLLVGLGAIMMVLI